jgi:hypothetical protein
MQSIDAKRWERRFGAAFLALLCASALIGAGKLYASEAWRHVEVSYFEEGLGKNPAELQMYVNCEPKYNEAPSVHEGVIDLGWLRPEDIVTVQAKFGGVWVHLEYELIVNGKSLPHSYWHNPGSRTNQQGGKKGQWVVHRSYSAKGVLLGGIGCYTHRPALVVNGPVRATHSFKGDLLGDTEDWWPWIVTFYAILGLVLVGGAVAFRAFKDVRAGMAGLVIGLLVGIAGLVAIGTAQASDFAVLGALASVVAGMHWCRFGLARGLDRLKQQLVGADVAKE